MTATTFSEVAARVDANGYAVIPIAPGKKHPGFDAWQKFLHTPGCEASYPKYGAGVLGETTPGVDVDVSDEDLVSRIENMVREVLRIGDVADIPRRVGRWPRVLLPFRTDRPFAKKTTASYRLKSAPDEKPSKVEILASGQQWVAYHIHPDTKKAYEWNGHDLLNTPRSELHLITEAMADKIISESEQILAEYGDRIAPAAEKVLTRNGVNSSGGTFPEGGRNAALTSLAGSMRHRGMTPEAIAAALLVENAKRCNPPLPAVEVQAIAASVSRYDPAQKEHSADLPKVSQADEFSVLHTAREIMAKDSGPALMCVQNRVPAGLVIVGGRPKARKSWLGLQLAIAKATTGRFMGMQTSGGRVLYIALEDNDRRMRQRLEFFDMKPESAPDNLHIFYEWPSGLEGVEKLERWLTHHPDTVLIIVDVLQRFRGPRDAKASLYEGDYQIMASLHGVTQRHAGLTVLVIHHVKKGAVDDPVEALNGTFAIAGAADAYIILRRGQGEQWIAHIDGRDWASWDHEFAWEFKQREGWVHVGVSDGVVLTETQQEIISVTREMKSMTPTKLAEHRQVSKQTAGQALQELVSKGAMRVFAGKYYVNGE